MAKRLFACLLRVRIGEIILMSVVVWAILGLNARGGENGDEPTLPAWCQSCSCKTVIAWIERNANGPEFLVFNGQPIWNGMAVQAKHCGNRTKWCQTGTQTKRYRAQTFTCECIGGPSSDLPIECTSIGGHTTLLQEGYLLGECKFEHQSCN